MTRCRVLAIGVSRLRVALLRVAIFGLFALFRIPVRDSLFPCFGVVMFDDLRSINRAIRISLWFDVVFDSVRLALLAVLLLFFFHAFGVSSFFVASGWNGCPF